jgi:pimeloyl-ACP methyl ester carboxylesterase
MKMLLFAFAALLMGSGRAEMVRLDVRPSATAPDVKAADSPHIVLFDSNNTNGDLLLWMPGTLGSPRVGPQLNFPQYAAQQGYRVIMLSYITDQGVSNICVGRNLRGNRSCAEDFRRKRIFGSEGFSLIPDQPQDAIVYRFTRLLQQLRDTRKDEHWEQYLNADGSPRWEHIAVAGQSQGGGNAAFIAKAKSVARVVMLSGGWDMSAPGEIADWYAKPGATPAERWYAAYHVEEPTAKTMAEISRALGVPAANVGALDKPVRGAKAHGEGLSNPAYLPWWKFALGTAE